MQAINRCRAFANTFKNPTTFVEYYAVIGNRRNRLTCSRSRHNHRYHYSSGASSQTPTSTPTPTPTPAPNTYAIGDKRKNEISGLRLMVDEGSTAHRHRARLVPLSTTKLELMHAYDFELRDLRSLQLASNSSKYSAATFFIRYNAFIVHLKHMTALISSEDCFLFNCMIEENDNKNENKNENDHTGTGAPRLQQKKKKHSKIDDHSGTAYNDYMLERFCTKYTKTKLQTSNNYPFQLLCLESIFKAVVSKHRLLLSDCEKECEFALYSDGNNTINLSLLKIKLVQNLTDTKSLVDAFHQLLNNKYDMELMYLTAISSTSSSSLPPPSPLSPDSENTNDVDTDTHTGIDTDTVASAATRMAVPSSESIHYAGRVDDDPGAGAAGVVSEKQLEFLLENYLWQFDEILDRFQLLLDEMQMLERSRGYKINQQRNEIIKMNLKLSVLTCGFSLGALTASVFGMNLVSHFEQSPYFFYCVLPVASCVIPYSIWHYFKKQFPFEH